MASMKRRGIVGLVTALVLGSPFLSARAMAADGLAVCVFSYDVQHSPGLSLVGGRGSWSGARVPLNCIGTVNGRQVSGAGVIAGAGQLEGTCVQGAGSGTFVATIPTTAGPVDLVLPVTFWWVGTVGEFDSPRFSGAFQFLPGAGDCLTSLLTRITVVQQGLIKSS